MNVYVYQAALLCESCGEEVCRTKVCPGNPDDEHTFDSDEYPKGPYSDGGGESDNEEHCDYCGIPLDNPVIEP